MRKKKYLGLRDKKKRNDFSTFYSKHSNQSAHVISPLQTLLWLPIVLRVKLLNSLQWPVRLHMIDLSVVCPITISRLSWSCVVCTFKWFLQMSPGEPLAHKWIKQREASVPVSQGITRQIKMHSHKLWEQGQPCPSDTSSHVRGVGHHTHCYTELRNGGW